MKRQKKSERDIKDDDIDDRLSDMPDHILLHIMEFMNIKLAVQTCVLSKRWKDLWKGLTNLTLHHYYSGESDIFIKFVSQILSCRDASIPLHNLDFKFIGRIDPCKTTLLKVMRYADSHNLNLQHLAIYVELKKICDLELPPSIFSCRYLTYLKLGFWNPFRPTATRIKFPKSLNLPALKSLHLVHLTFTTSDNGCAEPFSTCNMLNTLVIKGCYLQDDAQTLCITNSKVSSLTIGSSYMYEKAHEYKVVLCTPKLSSLTTGGRITYQAPSTCNLPLLEEVNIYCTFFHLPHEDAMLISWLQVLSNVKIMSLSLSTIVEILKVLSNTGSMRTQHPCFVRLKSLKVQLLPSQSKRISDKEVSKMVKDLLRNSPPARVDIIRDAEVFGRNEKIWEGVEKRISISLSLAWDHLNEWMRTRNTQHSSHVQRQHTDETTWKKPSEGVVKCNINAAIFKEERCFGIGICLGDHQGEFIKAKTAWYNGLPTP